MPQNDHPTEENSHHGLMIDEEDFNYTLQMKK
jgi:hypothetical protein